MPVAIQSAKANFSLCEVGSGPHQCERPEGIATDQSSGRIYVADNGNRRIDVFSLSGNFLFAFGWGVADGTTNALQVCSATCFKGISGSGAGQITSGEVALAVDNDPSSPSFHALYIGERDTRRVQKFDSAGNFIFAIGGGVNKSNGKNICTAISKDICGAGSAGGSDGEFNRFINPAVGIGCLLYTSDAADD